MGAVKLTKDYWRPSEGFSPPDVLRNWAMCRVPDSCYAGRPRQALHAKHAHCANTNYGILRNYEYSTKLSTQGEGGTPLDVVYNEEDSDVGQK